MNSSSFAVRRTALIFTAIAGLLGACVEPTQSMAPPLYPLEPPGQALPQPKSRQAQERTAEVRQSMWTMANIVRAMQHTLASSKPPAERQDALLGLLANLEAAATRLAGYSGVIDHPMFDERLADLMAETREAQAAARQQPPDFAPADTLVGACASCHVFPASGR